MIPTLAVQEIHDDDSWAAFYKHLHRLYVRRGEQNLELTRQRDMLARRCAEQARHIAGLLELKAEDAAEAEAHPLADAIAVMQRQGVR